MSMWKKPKTYKEIRTPRDGWKNLHSDKDAPLEFWLHDSLLTQLIYVYKVLHKLKKEQLFFSGIINTISGT